MDEAKSKAVSERLGKFQMLWPNVATEKGLDDAIKGGAAASGYLAASYALGIVLLLTGRGSVVGMEGDADTMLGFLVIDTLLTAAACALTWLIWKKRNLIAASVSLAWIAIEVIARLASMSGARGMIIAVFALIFAINGVRGALAARRQIEQASAV